MSDFEPTGLGQPEEPDEPVDMRKADEPAARPRGPRRQGPWPRRLERANLVLLVVAAVATTVFAARYFGNNDIEAGHTQRSGWEALLVSGSALLVFASAALFRPFRLTVRRMTLTCVAATLVFAVAIVTVWQLVHHDKALDTIVGTTVTDGRQSDAYLAKALPGVQVKKIPTGLYIQGVKFEGPEEVKVNGYVWQRLDADAPKSERGVVFPEAPDGYAGLHKDEDVVYEAKTGEGKITVGWHFNLTLRQKFDYYHYPLDKQNIWLRMWSANSGAVVLVPDFASYPPWKFHDFGLDQDMVSQEWTPYYTAFSYGAHQYNMTQGLADYQPGAFASAPELYFNIGVQRAYIGPLVGKLMHSLFIAAVMFLALFIYTRDTDKKGRYGFSTWTAIGFAVSMLLVIVVDQQQIREVAGGTALTYLEFFAIAQYIVIIGIFANALVISTDADIPALDWKDNLLPVLLYWPVLVGLFFLFTLLVFAT